MTNKGPRRAATDGEWSGRLTQAREEAERLIAELDEFAAWAEGVL